MWLQDYWPVILLTASGLAPCFTSLAARLSSSSGSTFVSRDNASHSGTRPSLSRSSRLSLKPIELSLTNKILYSSSLQEEAQRRPQLQEKATIFLWTWRSTVSFSITCERWGSPFHVANEVIIERSRKRAPKPRLAEERKKYQRSLQAFLSYAALRSRVSFRVPRARNYSRYPHMETSTALAGYEELVGGLKVIKLTIMYPIFTLCVQNCSNTLQVRGLQPPFSVD